MKIDEKPTSQKHINMRLVFFLTMLFFICLIVYTIKPNYNYIFTGTLGIQGITINNYNSENNTAIFDIEIEDTLLDNYIIAYLNDDNTSSYAVLNNNLSFCSELKDYTVLLKNNFGTTINSFKISDYIDKTIYLQLSANKAYLAIGAEKQLNPSQISIGDIQKDITWTSSDESIATVDNGKITAIQEGIAIISATDLYGNISTVDVVVTDLINNYILNNKKAILPSHKYTLEQSILLDEILAFRVNEAGYGTRAGAVASARFLTLEFKYSIPYFFENGRLNYSGTAYVDGEGRYYHKGLYLHKSKYDSIESTWAGPAIWGAPLKNFENDPYYVKYDYFPNGLDCSGFVSWALLNGGFDPGDYGAGETSAPNQMTDLGEYVPITTELIESGKIKVGDLASFQGHISIIIGIDDENYYIAETLNTFRKLKVNTYPKSRKLRPFTHIVLMDSYYKELGNYTQMWK